MRIKVFFSLSLNMVSEPREKTLSSQSNSHQKTLTAGNFSGELFRRIFPANFPAAIFFYTARSAWRRSPICPKAPEPETHPRAVHARFSGDALPPPSSPDADQPPFLPIFAIRALHVPLLGFFCFRGPFDQFFRRPPAIFSQPQSLHAPWEVFFYLSDGATVVFSFLFGLSQGRFFGFSFFSRI